MDRDEDVRTAETAVLALATVKVGERELSRTTADQPLASSLISATRSYRAQSRAERTIAAYREAWARFVAWCERERRNSLPASPETKLPRTPPSPCWRIW